MESQTLQVGEKAENGYMLLRETRANDSQPTLTFPTFNLLSYAYSHSNIWRGGEALASANSRVQ